MDKITRELTKAKELQLKEISESEVINQVKGLLSHDAAEDRQLLKDLGMAGHIEAAMNEKAKAIELEKLDNIYDGQVFHISQIEALAVNYRLRFLPTNRYKGAVSVELPARIKEFARKNVIDLSTTTLNYKFMMLAPAETFDLDEKKIVVDRDPALFYKISDEYYRLVFKWGKDFTILRAIEGFAWKNLTTYTLFNIMVAVLIGSVVSSLVVPISWYAEKTYWLAFGFFGISSFIMLQRRNWNESRGVIMDNLSEKSWFTQDRYR